MLYDKFAAGYDRALAPFEKRFLKKWRAEALSHLPENSRILEIGAGTGANFPFYPKTERAVASEISIKMLEIAKRKKPDGIHLVQTTAERLPFPVNYFDAAFATLVFCSIPNPETAFAELRRSIRPNGLIILLEHVRPAGALGCAFDFLNLFTSVLIEDHFNRETAMLAEKSGLKILERKEKAFGAVNLIVCENKKNDRTLPD